jgi:hypothetical protein
MVCSAHAYIYDKIPQAQTKLFLDKTERTHSDCFWQCFKADFQSSHEAPRSSQLAAMTRRRSARTRRRSASVLPVAGNSSKF